MYTLPKCIHYVKYENITLNIDSDRAENEFNVLHVTIVS